jgi:hypothetical protein
MPSTRAQSARPGSTDPSSALVDLTNESDPSTSSTVATSENSKSKKTKFIPHKRSVNTSDRPERASKRVKLQPTSVEPMSLQKKREMLEYTLYFHH